MNKVVLMGRLTSEPKISEAKVKVARYSLAVDRRTKEGGADFISCVAFDKKAEFVQNYCHKGTKLAVVGHIQTGSYTNKDGAKVYTTDVIVEEQEFAESKKAAETDEDGFMRVPDAIEEELPFI